MDRTPAASGPPSCFGRRREDDFCTACAYKNRCGAATSAAAERKTVAEAVEAIKAAPTVECPSSDDLFAYALTWMAKYKPLPTHISPFYRAKMLTMLESLRHVCFVAGWNAKRYVRAQVESLSLFFEGSPLPLLMPGHFIGAKADDRFDRWIIRREAKHGDARVDKHELVTAAVNRRRAATAVYASLRFNGCDRDFATKHACTLDADWTRDSVTGEERLVALASALRSLDPMLPHVVLLPPGPVSWSMIARLGAHIVPSRGGVRPASSAAEGEILL